MFSGRPTHRERTPVSFAPPAHVQEPPASLDRLQRVIHAFRDNLLSRQAPDGHWCGPGAAHVAPTAWFICLMTLLDRPGDSRAELAGQHLLAEQLPTGGWSAAPGKPADASTSTEAYLALKLLGRSPECDELRRARFAILELGGAEEVDAATMWLLALLNQVPFSFCPSLPPELLFLPYRLGGLLWRIAPLARPILVPLSVLSVHRPTRAIPKHQGISEIFRSPGGPVSFPSWLRFHGRLFSWANGYRLVDRGFKAFERLAPSLARRPALKAAERWILEHFEGSDGPGAGFAGLFWTAIALHAMGYSDDSAEMRWVHERVDDHCIEGPGRAWIQANFSPTTDTAWSALALAEAGVGPDSEPLRRSAGWLLDREIRRPGDWSVALRDTEPSGWSREYQCPAYPSIEDTGLVLMALERTSRFAAEDCQRAVHRALCLLIGLQSQDKGWARHETARGGRMLAACPFVSEQWLMSPSSSIVTAAVLEALASVGYRRGKPFVDDAIRYLFDRQTGEGYWTERSRHRIQATARVLAALSAIRYDLAHPRIRRAVDWLARQQGEGGCWDDDSERISGTPGSSRVVHTAWAVLGLLAAGEARGEAVRRGTEYLLDHCERSSTGEWAHREGTESLPGGPLSVYDLTYLPLLALARYRRIIAEV